MKTDVKLNSNIVTQDTIIEIGDYFVDVANNIYIAVDAGGDDLPLVNLSTGVTEYYVCDWEDIQDKELTKLSKIEINF